MARNKNQHFVPRAHLKPFSVDRAGKTIHLFNLERNAAIFGAPVRTQCSRPYFYGQNDLLEEAIQGVEGGYASCVADLVGRDTIGPLHEVVLKRFMYLQHIRTEAAARTTAMYSAELVKMLQGHEPVPSADEYFKSGIQAAMHHYADSMKIVDDLGLCVVRNGTEHPFVTSDDPSVLMNRWHMYRPANRHLAFGIGSAGTLMIMPVTPELTAILYDRDIYSFGPEGHMRETSDLRDIWAFNHFQALHCAHNIYFGNEPNAEYIREMVQATLDRRPESRARFTYAVADGVEGQIERFAVVNEPDFAAEVDMVMHFSSVRPVPAFWPPIFHYRQRRTAYTNGTRAGFIRKAMVARTESVNPWTKVRD